MPSDSYPVELTLVFSGPGGTFTASGTGTGVSTGFAHIDDYEFTAALTIQNGTHRYARASGTLALHLFVSVFFLEPSTTSSTGTIAGGVTPG